MNLHLSDTGSVFVSRHLSIHCFLAFSSIPSAWPNFTAIFYHFFGQKCVLKKYCLEYVLSKRRFQNSILCHRVDKILSQNLPRTTFHGHNKNVSTFLAPFESGSSIYCRHIPESGIGLVVARAERSEFLWARGVRDIDCCVSGHATIHSNNYLIRNRLLHTWSGPNLHLADPYCGDTP